MRLDLKLYENGVFLRNVTSVEEAKEVIAGLDYSMACVDCNPQNYEVFNAFGVILYDRKGINIP